MSSLYAGVAATLILFGLCIYTPFEDHPRALWDACIDTAAVVGLLAIASAIDRHRG